MPHALLAELQDAARRKDADALDRAMDGLPAERFDNFELLLAGINVKEAGFPDRAERVFRTLLDAEPTSAAGWYELAVVYRFAARHFAAVEAAREAVKHSPGDFRYRHFHAHMLYALGAHPEARAALGELDPQSPEEAEQVAVLRDFGAYLHENPRGRAKYLVAETRRQYYWMSTEQVGEAINAAIAEKRGFSLIRLGDGEGAFAKSGAEDEARYSALYRWMRMDWAAALFGREFDPQATGYASLVDTLMEVSRQQDIVGVPYQSWVEHEYEISSIRGVPCCLNVHRSLLTQEGARPLVCDQRIHIELHHHGLVEPILRRAGSVGVISCHSHLPERMKAAFGLEEVELFKIPGEKYTGDLRDPDQMSGEHFPFVFWDIIRRLSRPHEGRVFLIAAGTLAKFYAATIKRHGGVALDLGSLVDGWLNISSRPGYGSSMKL